LLAGSRGLYKEMGSTMPKIMWGHIGKMVGILDEMCELESMLALVGAGSGVVEERRRPLIECGGGGEWMWFVDFKIIIVRGNFNGKITVDCRKTSRYP
jgi:hypothetical protein